jgi:hypothetical protein
VLKSDKRFRKKFALENASNVNAQKVNKSSKGNNISGTYVCGLRKKNTNIVFVCLLDNQKSL